MNDPTLETIVQNDNQNPPIEKKTSIPLPESFYVEQIEEKLTEARHIAKDFYDAETGYPVGCLNIFNQDIAFAEEYAQEAGKDISAQIEEITKIYDTNCVSYGFLTKARNTYAKEGEVELCKKYLADLSQFAEERGININDFETYNNETITLAYQNGIKENLVKANVAQFDWEDPALAEKYIEIAKQYIAETGKTLQEVEDIAGDHTSILDPDYRRQIR